MIVIAMQEERDLIRMAAPDAADEPVLVTGVGAINVYRALKDVPRDTPILNLGYAGSNSIPVGTRVRVGRVGLYHPHVHYDEPTFELDGDTPCLTSCTFVTKTDVKEPCVFDMELAFILAMGFTNVTAIKTVSDNLSVEEFERCLE